MTKANLISSIGPVMQIAFVPEDFDKALAHWTETMGVGPFFFMEHVGLDDCLFNGKPSTADFGVALAYWGDLQVELIKQHNDAPSIYSHQPWRGSGGMHHVCLMTQDIEKAKATAISSGADIVLTANVPGGGAVFYAYPGGQEGLVEVLQPGDGTAGFFNMMKDAAKDWDGTNPLRKLG